MKQIYFPTSACFGKAAIEKKQLTHVFCRNTLLLLFMFLFTGLSAQNYCYFEDKKNTTGEINPAASNIEPLPDILHINDRMVQVIDEQDNLYLTVPDFNVTTATYQMLARRINREGVELWSNIFDIPQANGNVIPAAIKMDATGNLLVAGTYQVTGQVDYDAYLMKIDPLGNLVWQQTYSGAANGFDGWLSLATDPSGNIYASGATTPQGLTPDFSILAVDANGQQLWLKQKDQFGEIDLATQVEYLNGVVFASGVTQQNTNNWGLLNASYAAADGAVLFETPVAASNYELYKIERLIPDTENDLVYVIATHTRTTGSDFYIAQINTLTGQIIWDNNTALPTFSDARARSAAVDGQGNVFVAGYKAAQSTGRNIAVEKYTASGQMLWTKYFDNNGLDDEAYDIGLDAVGNFYLTGYGVEDSGNKNYLTLKADANGNETWRKYYNGIDNNEDVAQTIKLDSDDNILVSGTTKEGEITRHTTVKYTNECTVELPNEEGFSGSIAFIENKGQLLDTDGNTIDEVKFKSDVVSPTHYFFDKKVSLVQMSQGSTEDTYDAHRVDMSFQSDGRNTGIYPLEKRSDYYNYYLGHIPEGRARVPLYKNLVHSNAFPNIDVQYAGKNSGITYSFIVKPDGDAADLILVFDGQSSLSVNNNGELVLGTITGDIVLPEPRAYQVDANGDAAYLSWTPDYEISGSQVKFAVGSYDGNKDLVIEVKRVPPTNSFFDTGNNDWTTYYGGSSTLEEFNDIKTDNENNIFVTGFTRSTDFPVLEGSQTELSGVQDVFLLKFDNNAIRKFATYVGGPNQGEYGEALETDLDGNVYLVGSTDSNFGFPVLDNGISYYQGTNTNCPTPNSCAAGYIAKFDESGILTHCTFYDGGGYEVLNGIGRNSQGEFWVVGQGIANLLNTGEPFESSVGNGLILKFNSSLQLVWASNYGGSLSQATTFVRDVSFNSSDDVIITGITGGGDGFPLIQENDDSFLSDHSGGFDGFIAKITNDPIELVWSTYLGGTGDDRLEAVKVDSKNEIYVSGSIGSSDISQFEPSNPNAFHNTTYGGAGGDAYFAKFQHDGQEIWSTFFGGSQTDYGWDIEVDAADNVYFFGYGAEFTTNPVSFQSYYQQDILLGTRDAFIVALSETLTPLWITYYGGSDPEQGLGSHISNNNKLYITGNIGVGGEFSGNFPLVDFGNNAYFQENIPTNGFVRYGGYIARFGLDLATHTVNSQIAKNRFIEIFPNPASGNISLKFVESLLNENIQIQIYNSSGMKVSNEEIYIDKLAYELDFSMLSSGVYFLQGKAINSTAKFSTKFSIIK